MQEQFVAIDTKSLYPESRGKIMPDGSTRSRAVETAPSKATKAKESDLKKSGSIEAGHSNERERRLRLSQKDAEKSAERTKEQAQEAAKGVRHRAKPKEKVSEEKSEPKVATRTTPEFVESYPHLANGPYENLVESLASQNIQAKVPTEAEWRKMNGVEKDRWLKKHGVLNVAQLPKDPALGVEIYAEKSGERVVIVGRIDTSVEDPQYVQGLIDDANIDFRLRPPHDFESKTFREKLDWYQDNGVKIVASIEGGATTYPDNGSADLETLLSRLEEFDEFEISSGFANDSDRIELNQRWREVSQLASYERRENVPGVILRETAAEESIMRLRSLETLERNIGTAQFNSLGFDADRVRINESLARYNISEELVQRLMRAPGNVIEGDLAQAMQDSINYQISRARLIAPGAGRGFVYVDSLVRALDKYKLLAETSGIDFDRIVSSTDMADLESMRRGMDRAIEDKVTKLGSKVTDVLFGELDNKAEVLKGTLKYSGEAELENVRQKLMDYAEEKERASVPGQEGFFEWRAAKLYEGIVRHVQQERNLDVPGFWKDSIRNARNNFLYVESTDAPITQLQEALTRVARISEALTQVKGDDESDALQMKEQIDKIKNAVEAKFLFRREAVNSSMDPEAIQKVFNAEQWSDTTHRDFFSRFKVDHEGKQFSYIDPDTGNEIEVELNILDKGMQEYFRMFREDRQRANEVEEMSKRDLRTDGTASYDERWIALRLIKKSFTTEKPKDPTVPLPANYIDNVWSGLSLADKAKIEDANRQIWGGGSNPNPDASGYAALKDVISSWYRENLLIGAHGLKGSEQELFDIKRVELHDRLSDTLKNLRPGEDAWKQKVTEYDEAGLLNQVINVAHWEAWMMGAYSDYDGVRIYNRREPKWAGGTKHRQLMYIFNKNSSLFHGRMIDHYGEFLQDENRGRPRDANYVFRESLLGKRRGILGHNRLLVKVVGDNLDADKGIRDRLVVGGRRTFREVLTNKTRNQLEGRERLDIGSIGTDSKDGDLQIVGGNNYDNGWARGASIEELIDDCEISFENIEWSKVYENEDTNVIEFNMADWWGDRAETKKYFASGAMQEYLKNPGSKLFFQMNKDVFYSKREIRIQPWMKLVIPAHQAIGKHWQEWWKMPYDMAHAETEDVINDAARLNMLDYRYADDLKKRLVGRWPMKQLRYTIELADRNVREFIKRDWELIFFYPWEFFKVAGQQMVAQASGK